MPPVSKTDQSTFRKSVDFVAKDDAEQVATGIVMVPNKADLQRDFARPETIQSFAEQFATFEVAGEADGGVMHAVWPDDHIELRRNEVLDEATDIGGTEAPAGAWVQAWHFADDQLWSLVDDGILEGYSIGAINVDWDGPFEQDELDDVAVPDELGDNAIWELTDGIVREVSAVDIPAVPDAQILETKAEAEKRLADHLGNREGFIEEAVQRGHSEEEAERLWDYLSSATEVDGSDDPASKSPFARAGRAFLSALTGSNSGDDTAESPSADDGDAVKEDRTLSAQNRASAMAAVDANLDILQDAGVDHGITRFTDREDVDFNLTEHTARTWRSGDDEDGDGDEDEDGDEDDEEEQSTEHAAGGETPGDTMTDDDNTDTEPPAWAKELQEQINEQSERIDELANGGKNAGADGDDDPFDDAPEWAKALKEDVERQSERVDTISQQSGLSDQLDGAEMNDDEDETGLAALGKALS